MYIKIFHYYYFNAFDYNDSDIYFYNYDENDCNDAIGNVDYNYN